MRFANEGTKLWPLGYAFVVRRRPSIYACALVKRCRRISRSTQDQTFSWGLRSGDSAGQPGNAWMRKAFNAFSASAVCISFSPSKSTVHVWLGKCLRMNGPNCRRMIFTHASLSKGDGRWHVKIFPLVKDSDITSTPATVALLRPFTQQVLRTKCAMPRPNDKRLK